jgi:predicted outer membrane repeat protein
MSAYRIILMAIIACFISIATPSHAETVENCDFESFQSAVNRLNQTDDGGQIDFSCAGTIRFTETVFITSAITINGHDDLILDGYGLYTLFEIEGTLTLNGVIIQKGWTAIRNYGELLIRDSTLRDNLAYQIGAVLVNYGMATIENSTFTDNQTDTGGAIFNHASAYLTIHDSTFSGNEAHSQGGVIKNVGYIAIYRCTFTDNSAEGFGMVLDNAGSAHIEDSTFTHNGAPNYRADIIYSTVSLAVRRSIFKDNLAQAISSSGDFALTDSQLVNNAGGVYVRGEATIHNNHFQNNHAIYSGGAIAIWVDRDAEGLQQSVISNNTFIENSAEREGGAIIYGSPLNLLIINNTFLKNQAPEGGAIFSYGEDTRATILHNTFVDNAGIGGAIFTDSHADVQYNIFSGATHYKSQCSGAGAWQIDDTNLTDYQCGDAVRVNDLMLDESDGFVSLLAGSPAIDAYPAPCLAQDDQRGVIRASACDIGAVEWSLDDEIVIYEEAMVITTCTWDALADAVNRLNWAGGDILLSCPADTIIPFSTSLTIHSDLTITSQNPIQLVGDYSASLFTIRPTATLELAGIHISGGYEVNGGAIYNEGMLTLRDMTFSDNHAQWGGAVYNAGMMTVTDSQFKDNHAESGGAIFNETVLMVMNSTFTGNSAIMVKSDVMKSAETPLYTDASGGAIYNHHFAFINDSWFELNHAEFHGGAIHSDDTARMSVLDSQFISNDAKAGGALYFEFNWRYAPKIVNLPQQNTFAKPLYLENANQYVNYRHSESFVRRSLFDGNIATEEGGGAITNQTTLDVIGNLFIHNRATGVGGAITSFGDNQNYIGEDDIFIYKNTFIENYAEYAGAVSATWTTISNTFVRNEATVSGGAISSGYTSFFNNTFVDNIAPENPTGDRLRIYSSIIIEGDGECGDVEIIEQQYSRRRVNLVNVDCAGREPDLLLGEFDGWVVPLLAGNMAIDQYACDENYYEPGYDQLGTPRPQGGLCDLGAVEFIPPTP